jgi:hypothetical protein
MPIFFMDLYFLIKCFVYSEFVCGSSIRSCFSATHDIYVNLNFYILGIPTALNLMPDHCTMNTRYVVVKIETLLQTGVADLHA